MSAPTDPQLPAVPTPFTDEMVRQLRGLPDEPMHQVRQLVERALSPDWWEIWLQRGLLLLLLLIATLVILRLGRGVIGTLQESRNLPDAMILPLRRVLRGLVLLIVFLFGLQLLGVPMSTVWAAASAVLALIAVGFIAVWSVLSNVACSFLLLIFKPFRIGDMVEIVEAAAGPNVGGRVTDVTLMFVVMREESEDGGPAALIQVPNNLFFQKTIRRRAGRRSIPLEQHVDKHGLIGREKSPPPPDTVAR